MTAPALTVAPSPKLHQPKRALVAAVELVLVVVLGFAAHWCWRHGIQEFSYPIDGRAPLVSTRYHGNWSALAIVLATVGGVLVLDGIRQVVLAVRTRDRVLPEVE